MSSKRLRTSEEDEEEGEEEERCYSDPLLTLLPDELLRLILSKITDPKTLLISSLISKRIASILSLSQSLSLSLQFPTNLTFSDYIPAKSFYHLSLPFTKLLGRFSGVRSLRVVFPCSCHCPDHIVFKWKAKAGCRILSFLSTKFVSKIDDKKAKVEAVEEEEVEDFLTWADKAAEAFFYPSDVYRVMWLLISRHPNLENVEFVDSKKHGKLSIGGEELIELRTTTLDQLETSGFFGVHWSEKIWYAPKLRLTLSGFEMKEVTLVVIRGVEVANGNGGGGGVVEDNGDHALDGGFEDDEHGIFGEAMTQMLTKHPLKMFYL